jgi:hypothetical protein
MDHALNRNKKEDKIIRNKYVFNNINRVIGRYKRVIAETLVLLGFCVTLLVNISPTFRREVSPPYSGLRVNSRKRNPEYEGSNFLRNAGKAAQQPRRPCSSIRKHVGN